MAAIVLTTLNARYVHASFGLRYLRSNLGALRERCEIVEFEIRQRPVEVVERLLLRQPQVLGLGVYIWNARETLEVVRLLKRIAPEVMVVLGGPEVSYETDQQPIIELADYVITGEADQAFARLCEQLLGGERPTPKVIAAPLPSLENLALPYDEYNWEDLAHRVVYVEASRGCPFTCEFCLSSLNIPVRQAPLEPFLEAMSELWERGVRVFKFVDRTFNLNLKVSLAILRFFQQRCEPGMFVHFEMVPDRLPDGLREIIRAFPKGTLQFEIGIQTFNPEVAALISRRQHYGRLEENLRFLREETGVYVHADLIFGLPGESVESFGRGFDRLIRLGPQEIQVGMLKRLRGTPIVRHDDEWGMVYAPEPPYEVLRTRLIDFPEMQRMRRFARYWDLFGNSGNFSQSLPRLWGEGSPFEAFMAFGNWLYQGEGRTDALSLDRLSQRLADYLAAHGGWEGSRVREWIAGDYERAGRQELPRWLRASTRKARAEAVREGRAPKRQARRLG